MEQLAANSGDSLGIRLLAGVRDFFRRNIMIMVCMVLIIICSLSSEKFLTLRNIMSIFRQFSVVGMLAVGASIAIIVGGIDASVACVMCFALMVMGKFQEYPMPAIILVVLAVTFVVGTFSGIAIAYFNVVPFIATMAMATIAEGSALLVSDGKPIYWNENHSDFVQFFGLGSTGPIPNLVIGFFLIACIGQVILMKTRLGFCWRSIGGNAQAAYWSGIDTPKYTVLAYSCAAMMSGLAAVFMFARIGTSEPAAGITWTMDALAAAVLGGTVIGGKGKGSITGAILGAFMLGMINNIFNLINVSSYIQYIAKGFILFAAVMASSQTFRLPRWMGRST